MKLVLLIIIVLSLLSINASSQRLVTRSAHVNVKSENSFKNIAADNYQVNSVIDVAMGTIKFEGLLKSFEFQLGALDRVFASDKVQLKAYPKFKFEGNITGVSPSDMTNPGTYPVKVNGTLYLWDERRKTSANGTIIIDGNGFAEASSDFSIKIEENSLTKVNQILEERVPLNITTNSLGVSRNIQINLDARYKIK